MYCMDLTNKVAIITGGTKGIGRAIVQAFLDCGANVGIVSRNYKQAKEIADHFGLDRAIPIQADVSSQTDVEHMVSEVVNHFGKLDILVNNAGTSTMDYVEHITEADWDKVMDINAKGVLMSSQEAIKIFKQQGHGGKIINIASQAGKNGYRLMGNYVASKHAVLGLTKVMAIELASSQILVNAVCPGIIETDMKRTERVWGGKLRGLSAQEIEEEDYSQVPLGKTGQPEDVAHIVVFLASEYANYMTGQSINITGGMTMN